MVSQPSRVILIDPVEATREVLARRLRAQGYQVDEARDPSVGADMALREPPAAVVADLWMPTISGVQLCRLLRSEPATADVAVILCGETDEPRNRFWADRAGANAYVLKRRTGELVRALARAVVPGGADGFFFQLSGGTMDIRDRIARQLDAALFDLVIAAEVRALASCGSFDLFFDLFAQFLSQVSKYRWVAISMGAPARFAVHHCPQAHDGVDEEVCAALGLPPSSPLLRIEDEDAVAAPASGAPVVRPIPFGHEQIGTIALSPSSAADADAVAALVSLVAKELGGPIRMAALVEETQRLAATDPLTGLMNRRAFGSALALELARAQRYLVPLSLILLDVDHFKLINDRHGHQAGDRVLAALGGLLRGDVLRATDLSARWGGEEFVVAYLHTPKEGAALAAERLRSAIAALTIADELGDPIAVTVSIGLAELTPGESLESFVDRADRAMYVSKAAGRNRLSVDTAEPASRAAKAPPLELGGASRERAQGAPSLES